MMMMGSPRKVASLIVAKKLGSSIDRASQLRGESEEMLEQMNPAQDEGKVALVEAAQKLVAGMESKSPELIAKAFHTMFRLVEMMPHEEYHEEIEEAVEGY